MNIPADILDVDEKWPHSGPIGNVAEQKGFQVLRKEKHGGKLTTVFF